MSLLIGCIADDLTGASDIGLALASGGAPVTLSFGVPGQDYECRTPALVIAEKIRTVPPDEAQAVARRAADWLLERDARQLYFKYCSTFDSTPDGNIGPVTDALLEVLGETFTVLVPALPVNGRTVEDGILRVNGVPLAESPMRYHPLTPMRESFLPRLMDAQTADGRTTAIRLDVVKSGLAALGQAIADSAAEGYRYASVDAVCDGDLETIAEAVADCSLVTGGSGLASGLPDALRRRGLLAAAAEIPPLPDTGGPAAVIAGSCSTATQAQVEQFRGTATAIELEPRALADEPGLVDEIADRAVLEVASRDVLIYSTADAGELAEVQRGLGVERSAELIEGALGRIARALRDSGVRNFVVAGGETSGAVAAALELTTLEVGPAIAPGVPWMFTADEEPLAIVFKSGNFGAPAFFQQALDMLR